MVPSHLEQVMVTHYHSNALLPKYIFNSHFIICTMYKNIDNVFRIFIVTKLTNIYYEFIKVIYIYGLGRNIALLQTSVKSFPQLISGSIRKIATYYMGSATGLKLGGPKPLLNLKVSRSLILIYKFIKLSKILIHAFKY